MHLQSFHYEVQTDGRIVLENLPIREGQSLKLTLEVEEPTPKPAPPPSWEEIQAHRRKLRGDHAWPDLDPEATAFDNSEWDVLQD